MRVPSEGTTLPQALTVRLMGFNRARTESWPGELRTAASACMAKLGPTVRQVNTTVVMKRFLRRGILLSRDRHREPPGVAFSTLSTARGHSNTATKRTRFLRKDTMPGEMHPFLRAAC